MHSLNSNRANRGRGVLKTMAFFLVEILGFPFKPSASPRSLRDEDSQYR